MTLNLVCKDVQVLYGLRTLNTKNLILNLPSVQFVHEVIRRYIKLNLKYYLIIYYIIKNKKKRFPFRYFT